MKRTRINHYLETSNSSAFCPCTHTLNFPSAQPISFPHCQTGIQVWARVHTEKRAGQCNDLRSSVDALQQHCHILISFQPLPLCENGMTFICYTCNRLRASPESWGPLWPQVQQIKITTFPPLPHIPTLTHTATTRNRLQLMHDYLQLLLPSGGIALWAAQSLSLHHFAVFPSRIKFQVPTVATCLPVSWLYSPTTVSMGSPPSRLFVVESLTQGLLPANPKEPSTTTFVPYTLLRDRDVHLLSFDLTGSYLHLGWPILVPFT